MQARLSLCRTLLIPKHHEITCAVPGGGGIRGGGIRGGGGPDPPLKNHKNIGFSSNTGPDPLKNRSGEASIQCWAFIGMPAKRHLMTPFNGVSLVGR